jgi:energy-coupling factor transporter ATP-binding protein EcfA2
LPPIITIDSLSYAYPAPQPGSEPEWVLRDLSLTVEAGEFLAVMGPTGCGKTTLCLALNGIVPRLTGGVIRGEVRVAGLNPRSQPVAELARRVGLVFQESESQLFQYNVESEVAFGLENLGIPPADIHRRVSWALDLVHLQDHARIPLAALSGGQKQRVAIASILAMRPEVLVLDEPTANLDPSGKTEVFAAVAELRRTYGTTVIFVSHESEFIAEFSGRVAILNEGRVVLDGSPEAVFSQLQHLREIGLDVPQVRELADCLNRLGCGDFSFYQEEAAYLALTAALGMVPDPPNSLNPVNGPVESDA